MRYFWDTRSNAAHLEVNCYYYRSQFTASNKRNWCRRWPRLRYSITYHYNNFITVRYSDSGKLCYLKQMDELSNAEVNQFYDWLQFCETKHWGIWPDTQITVIKALSDRKTCAKQKAKEYSGRRVWKYW